MNLHVKFTKWIGENGYSDDTMKNLYLIDMDGDCSLPTKQMLIGYMFEYCIEKDIPLISQCDITSIDMLYDFLLKVIEEN